MRVERRRDQNLLVASAGLDHCLQDETRPPLERVRRFFELTQQKYREEGYMGCLLGGLGQELSGVSEVFRQKANDVLDLDRRLLNKLVGLSRDYGGIEANAEQAVAKDLRGHVHAQAACRAEVEKAARPADGVGNPVPEPDPSCQRDRTKDDSL